MAEQLFAVAVWLLCGKTLLPRGASCFTRQKRRRCRRLVLENWYVNKRLQKLHHAPGRQEPGRPDTPSATPNLNLTTLRAQCHPRDGSTACLLPPRAVKVVNDAEVFCVLCSGTIHKVKEHLRFLGLPKRCLTLTLRCRKVGASFLLFCGVAHASDRLPRSEPLARREHENWGGKAVKAPPSHLGLPWETLPFSQATFLRQLSASLGALLGRRGLPSPSGIEQKANTPNARPTGVTYSSAAPSEQPEAACRQKETPCVYAQACRIASHIRPPGRIKHDPSLPKAFNVFGPFGFRIDLSCGFLRHTKVVGPYAGPACVSRRLPPSPCSPLRVYESPAIACVFRRQHKAPKKH